MHVNIVITVLTYQQYTAVSVHRAVVTSRSVCVHTPVSTNESWFSFNHVGK